MLGRSFAHFPTLLTATKQALPRLPFDFQHEISGFAADNGGLRVSVREQKALVTRERAVFYVRPDFNDEHRGPTVPEQLVDTVEKLLREIPSERKKLLEESEAKMRATVEENQKLWSEKEAQAREWAMENDPITMVRDLRERVEKLEAKLLKR
jgi:hypothetical protein